MTKPDPGRLLLVADDIEFRTTLGAFLTEHGYEVVACPTPAAALQALRREPCAVLLTDAVLPGMDGAALLQAGVEIDPYLVGILMAGPDLALAADSVPPGTYSIIFKPVERLTLLSLVAQALELRRLRLEGASSRAMIAASALETIALDQRMRDAEAKYQSVFENAVEGLFQTTPAGRFLSANPAFARACGYASPADLISGVTDIARQLYVDPDQRTDFHRQLRETGRAHNPELQFRRKDGSVFWVSIKAFAVRDASGAVLYCEGTLEDITERKLAEQALQHANEELESRVARRTQELEAVNQELHTRAHQQRAVAELGQQALSGGDLETLMQAAVGLISSTLDVEFSAILELAPQGQHFIMRAETGWGPATVGHHIVDNNLESAAGYAVWSKEPVIMNDTQTESRFGISPPMREKSIQSGMTVLIHTEAGPFGVMGAYTDRRHTFTKDDVHFMQALANVLAAAIEHKLAEESILKARVEAERANNAKSEFLSRMSHELRTPLNAILGFAQLLEIEDLPANQRDGVEHILKGGRHLLELINEVLDITSIEAGRMTLSPEPVHAEEVLQEVLGLIQPLAQTRHVWLKGVGAGAGRYVQADRQRLKQVLLNLLSNAVKYNRPGGTVTLLCEATSEERLSLQIRDTGIGIAPEKMAWLFTPFERLGAEQTGIEGTGIGLALSKRLVELMGGTLTAESRVGEGSTFCVDLPQTTDLLELYPQLGETPPIAAGQIAVDKRKTVLYIEDNLSNLQLIESILRRRPGIKLVSAMQGRLGLDLIRQHRPDLVLLDLHLPDMMGDAVLQNLRDDPQTCDIPVVMLSADATPRQIERLRAAGAVEYLTKPLEVKRFLTVLDENLQAGAS